MLHATAEHSTLHESNARIRAIFIQIYWILRLKIG